MLSFLEISTISLIFLALICGLAFGSTPYTEEDLKVLMKSGSYREVIDHLSDITPTKRTEEWDEMLIKATISIADQHLNSKQCRDGWYFIDDMLKAYPQLKNSKEYLKSRRELGACAMNAISKTYYSSQSINEIWNAVINVDPSEETKYFLATNEHYKRGALLIDLLEVNPSKYMDDPKVLQETMSGLKASSKGDFSKRVRGVISRHLFAKLENDIRKSLESESSDERENAFLLLSEKGRLSSAEKNRYHIEVFMTGPHFSDVNFKDTLEYLNKQSVKSLAPYVESYFKQDRFKFNPFGREEHSQEAAKVLVKSMPGAISEVINRCSQKDPKPLYYSDCKRFYKYFWENGDIDGKVKKSYATDLIGKTVKAKEFDPDNENIKHALETEAKSLKRAQESTAFMNFVNMVDEDIGSLQKRIDSGKFEKGETKYSAQSRLRNLKNFKERFLAELLKETK